MDWETRGVPLKPRKERSAEFKLKGGVRGMHSRIKTYGRFILDFHNSKRDSICLTANLRVYLPFPVLNLVFFEINLKALDTFGNYSK